MGPQVGFDVSWTDYYFLPPSKQKIIGGGTTDVYSDEANVSPKVEQRIVWLQVEEGDRIEVNHGVVLLTAANTLRERGLSAREAIEQAEFLRLRPILMTALVGIVGMVPLALGLREGTELLKPMAVGVIGGLVFSVFLTLLFLPALYLLYSGRRRAAPSRNATG